MPRVSFTQDELTQLIYAGDCAILRYSDESNLILNEIEALEESTTEQREMLKTEIETINAECQALINAVNKLARVKVRMPR